MGLRCSINSVLPTHSAYVYVLCDVWYEKYRKHHLEIHTLARPPEASAAHFNGSIESDAAVQPPLGSQECLAASLPIEFLEFIVPDPLHEADQRN
jgi:hypothetical protein